jgi:hypothetical protein
MRVIAGGLLRFSQTKEIHVCVIAGGVGWVVNVHWPTVACVCWNRPGIGIWCYRTW